MEYNVQHWADTRSIERISCLHNVVHYSSPLLFKNLCISVSYKCLNVAKINFGVLSPDCAGNFMQSIQQTVRYGTGIFVERSVQQRLYTKGCNDRSCKSTHQSNRHTAYLRHGESAPDPIRVSIRIGPFRLKSGSGPNGDSASLKIHM